MKNPWSKFFWDDWDSDPGLRLCSLAAQGLWMRMLCVCARHEPKGYLAIQDRALKVEDIARLAGVDATEAAPLVGELEYFGVFSRDRKGRIYSRRMVRDVKKSNEGRKSVQKRWSQPSEKEEKNLLPNRVPTRKPSTKKPESRYKEKEEANASSKKKDACGDPVGTALALSWAGVHQGEAGEKLPKSPPCQSVKPDRRGSRLSEDWKPPDTDRAYARKHGFDPGQIDDLAEDFRDWPK